MKKKENRVLSLQNKKSEVIILLRLPHCPLGMEYFSSHKSLSVLWDKIPKISWYFVLAYRCNVSNDVFYKVLSEFIKLFYNALPKTHGRDELKWFVEAGNYRSALPYIPTCRQIFGDDSKMDDLNPEFIPHFKTCRGIFEYLRLLDNRSTALNSTDTIDPLFSYLPQCSYRKTLIEKTALDVCRDNFREEVVTFLYKESQ